MRSNGLPLRDVGRALYCLPAKQREVQLLGGPRSELPVGRGGTAGAGRHHHVAPVACAGDTLMGGRLLPGEGGPAAQLMRQNHGAAHAVHTSVTPDLASVGLLRQVGRHTYCSSLGGLSGGLAVAAVPEAVRGRGGLAMRCSTTITLP